MSQLILWLLLTQFKFLILLTSRLERNVTENNVFHCLLLGDDSEAQPTDFNVSVFSGFSCGWHHSISHWYVFYYKHGLDHGLLLTPYLNQWVGCGFILTKSSILSVTISIVHLRHNGKLYCTQTMYLVLNQQIDFFTNRIQIQFRNYIEIPKLIIWIYVKENLCVLFLSKGLWTPCFILFSLSIHHVFNNRA